MIADALQRLRDLKRHRGALLDKGSYEAVTVRSEEENEWIDAADLDAVLTTLQGADVESHRDCHDLVCNGDRTKPRNASQSGCSCRGREERRHAEMEALRAATLQGVQEPPDFDDATGQGWFVSVGRWGDSILTISERELAGKPDLTDEDAALIRGAARHLLSFIGKPRASHPERTEP